VKRNRLLHTSAIRLAIRYALLYALLIGTALTFLYWNNSQFIDNQIVTSLELELNDLKRLEQEQGIEALQKVIQAFVMESNENKEIFLLLSAKGNFLAGQLKGWPSAVNIDGKVSNIWVDAELIPNNLGDDGYWPVIATSLPGGERLLVGESISQSEDLQEYNITTMLLIFSISVTLALMMGLFLGRTILTRIDSINLTARAITNGNFTSRIPTTKYNDEFDELAQHLNNMFMRIDNLVTGMRQVTDNVAHDLRQPLSRLRNRLEVTLLESRNPLEYRHVINQTIDDVDKLLRTFNALLEIAQTESGVHRGDWKIFDLSLLAISLGELYQDQAENQHLKLTLNIKPEIMLEGNRDLIAQLLNNLLENAIKYSSPGGHIKLTVDYYEKHTRMIISDNGPGIPADQRMKVLERFTRLESARSTPGNGLGLSLVKAVADLHQAKFHLKDNLPGLQAIILFNA